MWKEKTRENNILTLSTKKNYWNILVVVFHFDSLSMMMWMNICDSYRLGDYVCFVLFMWWLWWWTKKNSILILDKIFFTQWILILKNFWISPPPPPLDDYNICKQSKQQQKTKNKQKLNQRCARHKSIRRYPGKQCFCFPFRIYQKSTTPNPLLIIIIIIIWQKKRCYRFFLGWFSKKKKENPRWESTMMIITPWIF